MLAAVRSHDQFNITIYDNDDRYRGLKGLRTVMFMNPDDMRDHGLGEFDLVDIASFSKDGSRRPVYGYRAVRYDVPRGCAAGYMPELNVLSGIADYSTASGQLVSKHFVLVGITPDDSAAQPVATAAAASLSRAGAGCVNHCPFGIFPISVGQWCYGLRLVRSGLSW